MLQYTKKCLLVVVVVVVVLLTYDASHVIPVSEKENTPPESYTIRNVGFWSTKSGAGYKMMLKDCKARARPKE